jgi:hypothetical protein
MVEANRLLTKAARLGEPGKSCDHGLVITDMRAEDAEWAAGLLEQQRREYARYSPVFWRPAEGARTLHERFLRRQIAAQTTVALRTSQGFILCESRPHEGVVDDFTLTQPRRWDEDGAALLLAVAERLAARGIGTLRVVTAHDDRPKAGLLRAMSLSVAEQWWVHELLPAGPPAPPGRVSGAGFSGLLTQAPPVYAPGGPVFLAQRPAEPAAVAAIAHEATERGAVLAVIPAAPDSALAAELRRRGWAVASDWYAGRPLRIRPVSGS